MGASKQTDITDTDTDTYALHCSQPFSHFHMWLRPHLPIFTHSHSHGPSLTASTRAKSMAFDSHNNLLNELGAPLTNHLQPVCQSVVMLHPPGCFALLCLSACLLVCMSACLLAGLLAGSTLQESNTREIRSEKWNKNKNKITHRVAHIHCVW
ncbi:hypothetical protein BDW42DRAFT_176191 [Aspergillus taichungensis]|uniref:Uncharacterized protein n=1 Tax=Aspergillus taichungensis TaxID=482145 RepID=A0A2J5HL02_9EURO|nr:hypothetical protein BDW42DRAFT_176191 [Aspergillus taichungensis]